MLRNLRFSTKIGSSKGFQDMIWLASTSSYQFIRTPPGKSRCLGRKCSMHGLLVRKTANAPNFNQSHKKRRFTKIPRNDLYIYDGHNHHVTSRPEINSSSLGMYSSLNVCHSENLGVSCIFLEIHQEFHLGLEGHRSNIFSAFCHTYFTKFCSVDEWD